MIAPAFRRSCNRMISGDELKHRNGLYGLAFD